MVNYFDTHPLHQVLKDKVLGVSNAKKEKPTCLPSYTQCQALTKLKTKVWLANDLRPPLI
jgi:hypothetical protein